MCLGVPGCIESISEEDSLTRIGKVGFGGISCEVSLAYVPEARVGDYVLVHVGFALQVVDQNEAQRILEEIGKIEDLMQDDNGKLRPSPPLENPL
jgi:hydrogenase expression/formation protein HypC